jgi:hypothetical protein
MARPLRVEFEDAIYHLCTQGNARQRIFRSRRLRSSKNSLPSSDVLSAARGQREAEHYRAFSGE